MKMRKILCAIMACAMILCTMGTVAFAETTPSAKVTEISENDLTYAVQFEANKQISDYNSWYVNVELTSNMDMTLDKNDGSATGYLSVQIPNTNWKDLPAGSLWTGQMFVEGAKIEADKPFKILDYYWMDANGGVLTQKYPDLFGTLKGLACGVKLDEDFINKNPGLRIEFALKLYNPKTGSDESITLAKCAFGPAAKIGDTYYKTLAEAVNKAADGDVVYVYPGTYTDEIVVNKSIVLTGDPAYGADLSLQAVAEKPVIKISDVTNGGVKYYTKNIVFDNLVFDVAENATGATWNVSALGYYYENTAPKEGLTVTNCDFINNSNISMSAIAANISKYAVKNNTFKNFTTAVHSYVDHGAVDEVVISGNAYAGVENIASVYYGAPATGNATIAITDNKSTDGSVAKIAVDDFGQTKATPATAYNKVTVSGNDGALVMHNYGTNSFTLEESGNAKKTVYTYRNEEILTRLADQVPQSNVYVQYGTDDQQAYVVNENGTIVTAEKVELVFEKADGAKDLKNSVWNLVLRSSDDELINRLNSADFTFELTAEDDMDYEIVETNSEIEINNVNNLKDRYEFHFKNKNNVADTATEITIGQVRFTGYGKFSFIVKDETTNAVHATTLKDNIVASYAVSSLIVNNTDENGDNDDQFGTINSEIIAPTSDLFINVDFPNAVANKTTAYQSMKVTVTGEDIKDIVFDLGSELVAPFVDQANKSGEAYTVAFDGGYRIAIKNVLTQNTTYDIKVEGAGYRTAHYTVNMQETDSKTINFWNNVKDAEADVEAGKMKQTKNFLAGDIVKDSKINTYDLSAVVSYFGETDLVGKNNAYAKYDLNRDGLIDSKDVAIVLVSWGN